jgi:hypothetical protein
MAPDGNRYDDGDHTADAGIHCCPECLNRRESLPRGCHHHPNHHSHGDKGGMIGKNRETPGREHGRAGPHAR